MIKSDRVLSAAQMLFEYARGETTKSMHFCKRELNKGDPLPVVSVLTLGELLYISFRTGTPDVGKALVENIDIASRVVPVERQIIEKAAALKAGRSIPYIDAIILATFMLNECRTIHTTDRNHFSEIKNKGINFVFH